LALLPFGLAASGDVLLIKGAVPLKSVEILPAEPLITLLVLLLPLIACINAFITLLVKLLPVWFAS